jgi:hypothetical protein
MIGQEQLQKCGSWRVVTRMDEAQAIEHHAGQAGRLPRAMLKFFNFMNDNRFRSVIVL